jgi:hypothetical protein
MTCDAPFAEARDYAELICTRTLDLSKEAIVNAQLKITAGAIHAAMSASGQCDCDLAEWATQYLKHLNIVLTAATQDCPCSTIGNEEKAAYLAFVNQELEKIRLGQVDACGGTGKNYPAFGTAELGVNIFNRAKIIQNRLQRSSV